MHVSPSWFLLKMSICVGVYMHINIGYIVNLVKNELKKFISFMGMNSAE